MALIEKALKARVGLAGREIDPQCQGVAGGITSCLTFPQKGFFDCDKSWPQGAVCDSVKCFKVKVQWLSKKLSDFINFGVKKGRRLYYLLWAVRVEGSTGGCAAFPQLTLTQLILFQHSYTCLVFSLFDAPIYRFIYCWTRWGFNTVNTSRLWPNSCKAGQHRLWCLGYKCPAPLLVPGAFSRNDDRCFIECGCPGTMNL